MTTNTATIPDRFPTNDVPDAVLDDVAVLDAIDTALDTNPDQVRDKVRTWLLNYAHYGTPEQAAATVDCILAQDQWTYLPAIAERMLEMRSGENSVEADHAQAAAYALSSLYECHDGPHTTGCMFTPATL